MTIYVPLGYAGAGKGTFAQLIQGDRYVHISTGDLTREELAKGTPFGVKYAHAISNHIMGGIPFAEILKLIRERVETALSEGKGVILDGFPKDEMQCEILDAFAQERDIPIVPLWIQVDETVALERITLRQICEKCKKIYHAKFSPPQTAGICDTCTVPLSTRPGDNPTKAAERIRDFSKMMGPVIAYYETSGRLQELSGNGTPEECKERFLEFHTKWDDTLAGIEHRLFDLD